MQEYAMAHPILTFFMFWIAVWEVDSHNNSLTLPFRNRKKKSD